ncbi:hypothetical protein OG440_37165 [Streptomyces sp. NBC_00637]|uniref:hypothetical protein n=1 Tax=Streptomyces sp. NBC_00637 TaxID=2903667 RepID=UPI0032529F8B
MRGATPHGAANIPVPSGEALLGDGYLVRHDTSAGALLLTAFADGTAATRKIGDLAAGDADLRGVTWTVDKFGGPAAYVDAAGRIHLVPSGAATQPLGAIESDAGPGPAATGLRPDAGSGGGAGQGWA